MGRALPLFMLFGSIGLGAFALANEPTPRASEAPKNPSAASPAESSHGTATEGVLGDASGDPKAKQEVSSTNRQKKAKSAANDKAKDKLKASQSGNDAALRQLPSPAQRGSE
jgi:hypothetical protein